jgi:hypothetical protein
MAKKEQQLKVSSVYDRLWEQKLSQAYHLLVPANQIVTHTEGFIESGLTEQKPVYENSSDIYESILGSAKGE